MRLLLIGSMEELDEFYHWLNVSTEFFEVEMILSVDKLTSAYYTCPIKLLGQISKIKPEYELVFVCNEPYKEIKDILVSLGIDENVILEKKSICKYLSKKDIMNYYSREIFRCYQKQYINDNIQVGEFTYGVPNVFLYGGEGRLEIGKFCSIAQNVTVLLGGEHRGDWCTTYPFNAVMDEFESIEGHPKSKGDVTIGNDVWMASDSKILSGVSIGDGCIIGANAVVTKDIESYSIVGGVPAKVIKKRFNEETIEKLEEMQWWNWDKEYIYDAVSLLQNSSVDGLFEYYNTVVKNK